MQINFKKAKLGRTGLIVSRIGIGASYGIDEKAIEQAVEQGINYLYWGSLRRKGMAKAIRKLARKKRGDIVVVIQSYSRLPFLVEKSTDAALRSLKLDYADVLLLGWWNHHPFPWILEEAKKLQQKGKVLFLGISTHNRKYAASPALLNTFDILHLRYNAAHRGAEKEVFPFLRSNPPGIVTYTATRWGTLLQPPGKLPPHLPVPRATDCYRFVLTHPAVDLCLCGPSDKKQLKEALLALEKGPMEKEELLWMQEFGDLVYKKKPRPSFFLIASSLFGHR